jgi:hypothetical protein
METGIQAGSPSFIRGNKELFMSTLVIREEFTDNNVSGFLIAKYDMLFHDPKHKEYSNYIYD